MKRSCRTGFLVVASALLASATYSAASAAVTPKLLVSADIDGDGKKDRFYRTSISKNHIEIGVRLTKENDKYFKIFDSNLKDFNNLLFKVEKRKDFIHGILCDYDCSDYRTKAISMLEKSISPEVLDVYTEESAGSAIFVNEKGRVVQEWYSD